MLNFTPVPRHGYRIGVPRPGLYREIFNSDSQYYGGTNLGNGEGSGRREYAVDGPPLLHRNHRTAAGGDSLGLGRMKK